MWPALENLGGLLYFIREKIMEFMEVVRKTEVKPCAYFLDGKRVSKSKYEYFYGTHPLGQSSRDHGIVR